MLRFPCRIVLHADPAPHAPDHLDVFVLRPGCSSLATFELPLAAAEYVRCMSTGMQSMRSVGDRLEPGWRTRSKPAHRAHYWLNEGPVSRDRGTVRELGSGWCEASADGLARLERAGSVIHVVLRGCGSRGPLFRLDPI